MVARVCQASSPLPSNRLRDWPRKSGHPLPAIADRDPGNQGVAAYLERGLAELGPFQRIDEERRRLPALCPLGAQLQLVVLVAELDRVSAGSVCGRVLIVWAQAKSKPVGACPSTARVKG